MDELEQKMRLLETIRSQEAESFKVDEQGILAAYKKRSANTSGLAIKILSIFGGILSALAFLGFLLILEIYDSSTAMLVVGLGFIAAAILISNRFERLILDTFGVSLYVLGFILFVIALFSLDFHEDHIIFMVMVMALLTLFLVKNYVLSFISVLTVAVSLLLFIISKDAYEAIHFYIIMYAVALTIFVLEEAALMALAPKLISLYDPLRIGLVFSLLIGLIALGKDGLIPVSKNTVWVSSIVSILLILYLIKRVLLDLEVKQKPRQYLIFLLTLATLLPTLFAPAIAGSLLIVLLSFKVNYRTGFVIGVLALIYCIGQYYYDLNISLLTKSLLLFSSGVVFLVFYLFFNKKPGPNENV
ncbi:DUF4401 domain-containing protein [Flagellimonas meishanensis]|uniref:DUF4401 domain-containing protein n=1 Tax=Flagellimonas meishanensis TaxID=2873264 RepID=UPI001CA7AAC5|nr:DUF4401 domain-containing protein [[Muricauda] meishanensis]